MLNNDKYQDRWQNLWLVLRINDYHMFIEHDIQYQVIDQHKSIDGYEGKEIKMWLYDGIYSIGYRRKRGTYEIDYFCRKNTSITKVEPSYIYEKIVNNKKYLRDILLNSIINQ